MFPKVVKRLFDQAPCYIFANNTEVAKTIAEEMKISLHYFLFNADQIERIEQGATIIYHHSALNRKDFIQIWNNLQYVRSLGTIKWIELREEDEHLS